MPVALVSSADTLMLNAKGFAMSAETLLNTSDPKHGLTVLHLCCLSLELSFKAFIKLKGGSEKELRQIGHNLDAAYERSVALGLIDPGGRVGAALRHVTPIYAADFTRYFPDVDGFHTLTPEGLVELARAVALGIEEEVWPEPMTETE